MLRCRAPAGARCSGTNKEAFSALHQLMPHAQATKRGYPARTAPGTHLHVPLCPQKSMGAMAEGDTDEFKRVLLEGNPFFLGLTFCVSMLHSVSRSHRICAHCPVRETRRNHISLAASDVL